MPAKMYTFFKSTEINSILYGNFFFRDKVLKSIGTVDVVAKEKSEEVRKRYEKKLQTMQKELSKLQNAKREHQRLQKTKVHFLSFHLCLF